MSFSRLIAGVFGILFIVILYFIIVYALKIMAKDVKSGGKRRPQPRQQSNQKHHGIEVIQSGENKNLKVGSIIPIKVITTIGRSEENSIVLTDQYVSGKHARIVVKNNVLLLEDLGSTNGTFLNQEKINGRVKLFTRDEIRIGTAVFKVLT